MVEKGVEQEEEGVEKWGGIKRREEKGGGRRRNRRGVEGDERGGEETEADYCDLAQCSYQDPSLLQ